MPTHAEPLSSILNPSIPEYIQHVQYALDIEHSLDRLDKDLNFSVDPEEIIMATLKRAAEFYDGDWAGILEGDLSMKMWSGLLWYNRLTGGMTPSLFEDYEDGDYLGHWFESVALGEPVIISDVEDLKEHSPKEYSFLKYNRVNSIMAVPFWGKPTGYLVVRNPKRYSDKISMLKMMAFVSATCVNEKRLMDRLKRKTTPANIQTDNDVIINLFGELQVLTSSGSLTEKELNSPKITRLIAYLVLHKARPASAYEIFNDLWPGEDPTNAQKSIRNLVYRTQQLFGSISQYRLIESTVSGYRINPSLNVYTDIGFFDECWRQFQATPNELEAITVLKKAIDTYKDGLRADFYSNPWFVISASHYSMRFEMVMSQLLSALHKIGDYHGVHEYAANAIHVLSGSPELYFWLIYSIQRLGATEIAKSELRIAKQTLLPEDYAQLLNRLNALGMDL